MRKIVLFGVSLFLHLGFINAPKSTYSKEIKKAYLQTSQPIRVNWKTLAQINEGRNYSPLHNKWVLKAEFSEAIKELDNKEIIIKGYLVPTDVTGDTYVLSSQPFSSCFFCGGAGKETVMELNLSRNYLFITDDVKTFRGKLKLNNSPYELYYLLENAELISE